MSFGEYVDWKVWEFLLGLGITGIILGPILLFTFFDAIKEKILQKKRLKAFMEEEWDI